MSFNETFVSGKALMMALQKAPLARDPVTPESLLVSGESLGTDNDSAVMTRVILRANARLKAGDEIRLDFDRRYYCEDPIQIKDGWDLTFTSDNKQGGIGQRTLKGSATTSQNIRARDQFRLIRGGRYYFGKNFSGKGPRAPETTGKNTTYEGQAFITARSVAGLTMSNCDVRSYMGDVCHMARAFIENVGDDGQFDKPCSNFQFTCSNFYHMGRTAFVPNALDGGRWSFNTYEKIAASIVDVEPVGASGGGTRNLTFQHDTHKPTNGLSFHFIGSFPLENVLITDLLGLGRPITIDCIGPEIAGNPYPFRNIRAVNSLWDKHQTGGHFRRYWRCDMVEDRGNEGPIRYNYPTEPDFVNCKPGTVIDGPNNYTIWRP